MIEASKPEIEVTEEMVAAGAKAVRSVILFEGWVDEQEALEISRAVLVAALRLESMEAITDGMLVAGASALDRCGGRDYADEVYLVEQVYREMQKVRGRRSS